MTELWQSHHSTSEGGATAALLDLIEKLVVFQEAAQSKQGYALVADKVVQFAELLASQGRLHPFPNPNPNLNPNPNPNPTPTPTPNPDQAASTLR